MAASPAATPGYVRWLAPRTALPLACGVTHVTLAKRATLQVMVVLSMLESVLVSPEEVYDMMAKYQVPCPRPFTT